MRLVESPGELEAAFRAASAEAEAAFSDGSLYLEKAIELARHVEIQVLCDGEGGVLTLGERDCSIQRRHQKLIEETPSPGVTQRLRDELEDAAARACASMRYRGAGTLEFLVDGDEFYFIEMNTRLQVEHPVSELVTGVDLVRGQIRVAAGEGLPATGRAERRGHAIEIRINAEDPSRGFLPAPGTITRFRPPLGPGVRVDTHVYEGYTIPPTYDSLLAKLVVWDEDRPRSLARLGGALAELELEGVPTTSGLAAEIVASADFAAGAYTTAYLDDAVGRLLTPRSAVSGRRAARRQALFLLYQWDLTGQPLASLHEGEIDPFARTLAEEVVERAPSLDRRITEAALGWTADRLGVVERNVLRMAIRRARPR